MSPRLAVRALILKDDRLLLVNAWRERAGKPRRVLLCAPGGGVERGSSLPENLKREVFEETGLKVKVNDPCLVNEFHDPKGPFHQVDIYFRCDVVEGEVDPEWKDPEGIVSRRMWVTRGEMETLSVKPDSLAAVAWGDENAPGYDPLEPIVRG